MKTIIAGSRTINDPKLLKMVMDNCPFKPTLVICGLADGVDKMGERWAIENKVPVRYFEADWKNLGKSAGPIRNRKMAEEADALIYLWDGKSLGTKNMIQTAKDLALDYFGAEWSPHNPQMLWVGGYMACPDKSKLFNQ